MNHVELRDRDRANLLALVLERLVRQAPGTPPRGSFLLRAGSMAAGIEFAADAAVVTSGSRPADCVVEGSLATLAALSRGASAARAWWRGELRWSGSPFRALALAKFLRPA